MKKIILFLILFITFTVTAQESKGIICYNLTRGEMIEFQQNSDQYMELIRDILRSKGASFLSFIIQSGDTFIVNMIGISIEKDVVFLYDSSKKILKISYISPTGFIEKVISNVEIYRNGFVIKLNKLDTPFIVQFANDIFGDLGIRQLLTI
jgi:hypothetical protein